jgi:predicted acyl esterase
MKSAHRVETSAAILLFSILLLFFVTNTIFSQQKRARDDYGYLKLLPRYNNKTDAIPVIRTDFQVVLRDGTVLDALKFIPDSVPPVGGWPTVIFVHGYGDNKETLAGFAQAQAEYGYYTATFSMRGQGNSTGLSNLISSVEAQDMIEFVTAIKNDSANGSSPGNILIMGGSQGGMIPYMASCMGMNVKTIISALAPPNFASSWIENGSIKMTFLWTIEYTPDTARYTPLVDRMSDWIYANNKKYWDSLATWLPPGRDFLNLVPNNKVPLIMEGSWQDKFFNASGIIKAADANTGSFFRLYLGAVQGHGGDHSPTEDQWHMNFFNEWFFYWLFNQENGMLSKSKYEYASTTYPVTNNYWTFIHDSSKTPFSQITTNYRLYFNTNGRLTKTPNTTSGRSATIRNQVSGGLTMEEAVNEEFTGTTFNSKFKKKTITFTSPVLASDLKWLGTPKINLNYYSSAKTFVQYNFQVYEVLPNGTQRLINRANYTDRNYSANSIRTRNFDGQAHSHVFKAGNRIRIIVTNLDTSPDDAWFLGTNPFVLPALNNGYNYIALNNKSYIDIPVIGTANQFEADIVTENLPLSFSLEQNYPNPFNPSTVIKFTIPSDGVFTELKVFDVTGRQVSVLVNQTLEKGNYEILFEGSNISSGVYFYSIKAGSFYDVRRMILVK